MEEIEYREFGLSMADGDSYVVEGYAATFDEPYRLRPGMNEMIRSDALDGADMGDVLFLLNHQGMPLARTGNGTLSIERDSVGLKVRADLSGCAEGRALHEAVKNGLVNKMSWAFTVARGGWDFDEATRTARIGKIERVYDVSAVSRPANKGTEIHARSYLDALEGARGRNGERARIAALLSMSKGV